MDEPSLRRPDAEPTSTRAARPRPKPISLGTLLAELADPKWRMTASHLKPLAGMGRDDVSRLESVWPNLPAERRRAVIREVLEIAEDNVDLDFGALFEHCLGDSDDDVRALAAAASEVEQGWVVGSRLVAMLQSDPALTVRQAAAEALSEWVYASETAARRPRWRDRLVDALMGVATSSSEELSPRCNALRSVAYAFDERLAPLIREFHAMPEALARRAAVLAMGRSCDPMWIQTIIAEMKSRDPGIRFEAAQSAREIGSADAVLDLVRLTNDHDAEVREAAIAALGEIGGPIAIRVLAELASTASEERRESIAAALAAARENEDPLGVGELRPQPRQRFTAPPREN